MSYRENLLRSHETGDFLQTVYACATACQHEEHDELALELAALHNEELIDIVEAFESLENTQGGSIFFLTRHIFEIALPNINASVPSVMRCAYQLYQSSGQDLAASTIIDSLVKFCQKASNRPGEALDEIEANPDNFANLLPAILTAGSKFDIPFYLKRAICYCADTNIELRKNALFSIGNFNFPDESMMLDSAIKALEHSSRTETDDQVLACIFKSAFALSQKLNIHESRIAAIITTSLSKGAECTLYEASVVFAFHASGLTTALFDTLTMHLTHVNPSNKGTLRNIDFGITALLKNGEIEKAIQILEGFLLRHSDEIEMGVFDNTAREILNNKNFLSKILTRWFLRGDRPLCKAVCTITGASYGNEPKLEIDPVELKPHDFKHILFIAKKIIGYLFWQPISATSALISLMHITLDEEILQGLGELLLNPLLLNYPGKAREYAIQQSELASDKIKPTIDQALQDIDRYFEELRSVDKLEALHPSEMQREAYHRHLSRIMEKSYEAAEKQSIFLNIFTKSVLLYGRKSINYVYDANGLPHRTEIPLHRHGVELEFPRMENLEPFGLDYMLRIFRNERFTA